MGDIVTKVPKTRPKPGEQCNEAGTAGRDGLDMHGGYQATRMLIAPATVHAAPVAAARAVASGANRSTGPIHGR